MSVDRSAPLVAVDVGNSRIKLGLFPKSAATLPAHALPEPAASLDLNARAWEPAIVAEWLATSSAASGKEGDRLTWGIASVYREASSRLADWVRSERSGDQVIELTYRELPLVVALPAPECVGIDRLLGAVAANRLRAPQRAAVVVDLGSAITVDLVSPTGEFRGGAILPGIGMSARALFEQTDLLPHLPLTELDQPPAPLGTSTALAIESGLFWGAVGAVRELVARLTAGFDRPPHVFLTGGAAPSVANLLGEDARYLSHLVLAGIALSIARVKADDK